MAGDPTITGSGATRSRSREAQAQPTRGAPASPASMQMSIARLKLFTKGRMGLMDTTDEQTPVPKPTTEGVIASAFRECSPELRHKVGPTVDRIGQSVDDLVQILELEYERNAENRFYTNPSFNDQQRFIEETFKEYSQHVSSLREKLADSQSSLSSSIDALDRLMADSHKVLRQISRKMKIASGDEIRTNDVVVLKDGTRILVGKTSESNFVKDSLEAELFPYPATAETDADVEDLTLFYWQNQIDHIERSEEPLLVGGPLETPEIERKHWGDVRPGDVLFFGEKGRREEILRKGITPDGLVELDMIVYLPGDTARMVEGVRFKPDDPVEDLVGSLRKPSLQQWLGKPEKKQDRIHIHTLGSREKVIKLVGCLQRNLGLLSQRATDETVISDTEAGKEHVEVLKDLVDVYHEQHEALDSLEEIETQLLSIRQYEMFLEPSQIEKLGTANPIGSFDLNAMLDKHPANQKELYKEIGTLLELIETEVRWFTQATGLGISTDEVIPGSSRHLLKAINKLDSEIEKLRVSLEKLEPEVNAEREEVLETCLEHQYDLTREKLVELSDVARKAPAEQGTPGQPGNGFYSFEYTPGRLRRLIDQGAKIISHKKDGKVKGFVVYFDDPETMPDDAKKLAADLGMLGDDAAFVQLFAIDPDEQGGEASTMLMAALTAQLKKSGNSAYFGKIAAANYPSISAQLKNGAFLNTGQITTKTSPDGETVYITGAVISLNSDGTEIPRDERRALIRKNKQRPLPGIPSQAIPDCLEKDEFISRAASTHPGGPVIWTIGGFGGTRGKHWKPLKKLIDDASLGLRTTFVVPGNQMKVCIDGIPTDKVHTSFTELLVEEGKHLAGVQTVGVSYIPENEDIAEEGLIVEDESKIRSKSGQMIVAARTVAHSEFDYVLKAQPDPEEEVEDIWAYELVAIEEAATELANELGTTPIAFAYQGSIERSEPAIRKWVEGGGTVVLIGNQVETTSEDEIGAAQNLIADDEFNEKYKDRIRVVHDAGDLRAVLKELGAIDETCFATLNGPGGRN